jgi:hypothetical protein
MYWCCSSEHGSGWTPHQPKQAFSRSELTKEIRRLIEEGWFTDLEILQLSIEGEPELAGDPLVPLEADRDARERLCSRHPQCNCAERGA